MKRDRGQVHRHRLSPQSKQRICFGQAALRYALRPWQTQKTLTTNFGAPVPDNQHSLTAGERGPILLQDYFLIEKLAHFDRERIPERVVHAKGAGAFGYFEATHDMSSSHARAFPRRRRPASTPVLVRFSTVGGEKGSADADRDPRGFAIKFYTEEGNYDLVGNNTPVFFIRDPFKFPDMVHTHKRNPQSNLKDHNAFWDFFSHTPESTHQVTILFSDRGTPRTLSPHARLRQPHLQVGQRRRQGVWVKYHFKTEAGIQNLTAEEAARVAGERSRPRHARSVRAHPRRRRRGVEGLRADHAARRRRRRTATTRSTSPRSGATRTTRSIPIGRLVLDRNPDNFFAEIEQAAFSPANFVPGIEPSPDKLLQGRLFSYPDTQRHRLGPNYALIPVNCPYAKTISNYQRDGFMRVDANGGGARELRAEQRTAGRRRRRPRARRRFALTGTAARTDYPRRADDFEQAGLLYRVLDAGRARAAGEQPRRAHARRRPRGAGAAGRALPARGRGVRHAGRGRGRHLRGRGGASGEGLSTTRIG